MASELVLSVKDATIRFSGLPVFEDLSFNLHQGSKIALVGKNGAGKTTLMRIITGEQDLDAGERWQEIGLSVGYLKQDIVPKEGETVFDFIFEEIKADERELHQYKVDLVAEALELDVRAPMTMLSGGQLRRAGLARALVEEPDVLLLDEPTNHLDLGAIEWLEGYLKGYRGTLMCISHDKTFLGNITNRVFWLDRGKLKVSPRGFAFFDEWSTMLLEQEARELRNRKQIVAQEVEWASRGIPARRKRNQKRLELMKEMRDALRADESAYRRATATIKLGKPKDDEHSSKVVAEFHQVCKSFTREDGQTIRILDKFNLRILRGDRIGILGKNGSGKTTFLKMLLGEMEPDMGRVKRRKELEFSYFDQKRSDLVPEDSLWKTLSPSGGDYIEVMGKQRHVCGYLKDFMFDPADARNAVFTLSGGQKNRLMLAKVLASPKSCLILDEPTNDLDMETLDMLEEILSQYQGTLIVVSHDRDFLDQTVTKILAFEGNAHVEMHIGGYSDYLEVKKREQGIAPASKASIRDANEKQAAPRPAALAEQKETAQAAAPKKAKKLTFALEHELKQLPGKIEKLSAEVTELNAALADADFYNRDPAGFHETTQRLAMIQGRLQAAEDRWLELEGMREGLAG